MVQLCLEDSLTRHKLFTMMFGSDKIGELCTIYIFSTVIVIIIIQFHRIIVLVSVTNSLEADMTFLGNFS